MTENRPLSYWTETGSSYIIRKVPALSGMSGGEDSAEPKEGIKGELP